MTPDPHTAVIAFRSDLFSLHYPRHPLLLALLPTCASTQVFRRQVCRAYVLETLRTMDLQGASHQYELQDVHELTNIPDPASLPIQER